MPAERQILSHGFGPFYSPESRILILGSFPSVKSREQSFFYGHPRNRFWPVLAAICREETPQTLDEKKDFLRPILEGSRVGTRIFTNGGKASALYARYLLPNLGIPAEALPSTSPANAAWTLEKLVEAWGNALAPHLK